jgi:hypothetical protein
MKKSCWDIVDLMYTTSRVVFDREVSREEAKELWCNGEYEDVIDVFEGDCVDPAVRVE